MAKDVARGMLGMGSSLLAGLSCTVHPVVLATIVDSYERRNEDAKRVIGTLLGNVDKGVVEITNCFTVPHNESEDEVAVDIEFAKNMYELHKKVNLQEVIVGWYSTGNDIMEHSVLIHDYYMRECKTPVHLTVDTTLRNQKMSIKAFISLQVGVPEKTLGNMFTPIPLEIVYQIQERVGLDYLVRSRDKSRLNIQLSSNLAQLSDYCVAMVKNLGSVLTYVDSVVEGKIPSDPQVGRLLMELVNSSMSVQNFNETVNRYKKDLLMLDYLASLAKTQLLITEKLNQL